MDLVTEKSLIDKIVKFRKKKDGLTASDITFIIERYFYYATQAMLRGFSPNGTMSFRMEMNMIVYRMIPKNIRSRFKYSERIFGYTFVPTCDNKYMKKYGYNFRPGKEILQEMKDFSETDEIYKVVKT